MATKLIRLSKERLSLYKEEAWKNRISLNAWFLLLAEESLGGPKAVRVPKEPRPPAKADAVPPKSTAAKPVEAKPAVRPLTNAEAFKKLQEDKAKEAGQSCLPNSPPNPS